MVSTIAGKDLFDLTPAVGGTILAFVVVGALSVVLIQVFATMTTAGVPPAAAAAPPPTGRPIRATELSIANGDDGAPLYLALKDPYSPRVTVFDMSSAPDFYGPGGPYHCFAACDATVGLAKSSLDPAVLEGRVEDLSASEQETHIKWHTKYSEKYPVVGWLVRDGEGGNGASEMSTAASTAEKKDA